MPVTTRSQSRAAGGQQGIGLPVTRHQTHKTRTKKIKTQSSGKSNRPSVAQNEAKTELYESTKAFIGKLVENNIVLKFLWQIWLISFHGRFFKLTIFVTLLAVCYFMKPLPNFGGIGYSKALIKLRPELKHESYERKLDVKHITESFVNLTSMYSQQEVHVVISGGPGSGKTELARQFGQYIYTRDNWVWLHRSETYIKKMFDLSILPPPVDVVTLNAESLTVLQHDIDFIIGKFEGKTAYETTDSKETGETGLVENFLRLKDTFKKRSSRPVLIIDNVKKDIYKILFKSRDHGKPLLFPGNDEYGEIRVVVTTQHRPILELTKTHYLNLFDGMPLGESIKLLNAISGIHDDDKNASYLAKELGGLPFSLANAALYIKTATMFHGKEWSYYHYLKEFKLELEEYRSNIEGLWKEAEHEGLPYETTMLTTSIKKIEQLFNTSDGDLYKDLACFVGYCDSQTISARLFWNYTRTNSALHDNTNYQVMLSVYRSSIYELQTLSGHTGKFILTHQVTREASRIVCKLNDTTQENSFVEESFARIIEVLSKALDEKPEASSNQITEYTTLNFKLVDVLMSLVSYSFRLNFKYSKLITKDFCWKFLNSMAEPYLYWPNKHKSAIIMPEVQFLVNLTERSFSDGEPELGAFFSVLYVYYTGNQQPRDLQTVVELVEGFANRSLKNIDNTSVVNATLLLNMMGTVYRGAGQMMSKAQELHELALDISHRYVSLPMKAISLNLLGIIHRYRKRFDIAQKYHEEAVELASKIYSKKHPHLGAFLLNLAVVYNRQGKLTKAKVMYQEALDIMKEAYGIHDQRVARVLNTLATNYYSLGQYNDSIHALLEALSIHEEIHGDIHPNVGETLFVLGFTYRANGDLEQSLEALERSLKIRTQYYGSDHYHVGEVLHDLSNTQRELNHLEDALSNGKRCLDILKRSLGKSSEVGNALNGIGLIYSELGNLTIARNEHEEALEIFEELSKHGSQAVGISETLKHIGNVFKKLQDTKKAMDYFTRALSIIQTIYDENHPRIKELNKLLDEVYGAE